MLSLLVFMFLNLKLLVFSLHGNGIFELMAKRVSRWWVLSRGSLLVSQDLTGFSRNESFWLSFCFQCGWSGFIVEYSFICTVMLCVTLHFDVICRKLLAPHHR